MPDFHKAKVGDKVWDLRYGDGEIVDIDISLQYAISAKLKHGRDTYDLFGHALSEHLTPMLYWSKPEISDPPPPKRMIKKEGWINIYSGIGNTENSHGLLYSTKEEARLSAGLSCKATIHVEWEEEE